MDRFLFVLGSNWQLSIAELDNVLMNYQRYAGKIVDYSANIAIVEFDNLTEDRNYINALEELQFLLGGCQKIAKIYDFIFIQTIKNAFPLNIVRFREVKTTREKILSIIKQVLIGKDKIFPKVFENMFYAISIYPNLYDDEYYSNILVKHFLPFLNTEIVEILKEKGALKPIYFQYPEKNIRSGNLNPIFPHITIKYELFSENRAEIIFGFTEEGVYIARTFTADNPNFKKLIDEQRPNKEFKSSISPKLALILLNFLNLFEERETKLILDPFVGNGTIVMFALLQGFQISGTDIDEKKANNTLRNVYWLLEEIEEESDIIFKKFIKRVEVSELSKNFKRNSFDGISTEPELGPFYKKKPYYLQARDLMDNELEPLFDSFFREAQKVLKMNKRISMISPVINTFDGKEVQLNLEKLAREHGFNLIPLIKAGRIVNKSNQKLQFRNMRAFLDAKRRQIIKRKIYVFEKVLDIK